MIELLNINKTFLVDQKEVHAVKDVNLHIQKGEIFGVIGFSGAGKSTLVRTINLLERPTSGQVIIDGVDITRLSDKELRNLRQSIGMIFQHFNLMPSRTVFENIYLPLKRTGISKAERVKKIEELLELVELKDKAQAYPNQLSGGQKQRVAIARALACSPKILLCDEATSALDPKTTNSILKLLKDLNEKLKLTIVVITHQMSVVKDICDRAALMENGRVIETNTVYNLFSHPNVESSKDFIEMAGNKNAFIEVLNKKNELSYIKKDIPIYLLTYTGDATGQALMSKLYALFKVEANILFGNIDYIKDKPLGQLAVQLSGENENIEKALEYIKEQKIDLEVLR